MCACAYEIIRESLVLVLVLFSKIRSAVSNRYNWRRGGIIMASFGKIGEFSPDKETISNYLERVEIFFRLMELPVKRKCQYSSASQEGIYTLYFEVCCHQLSHRKRILPNCRQN